MAAGAGENWSQVRGRCGVDVVGFVKVGWMRVQRQLSCLEYDCKFEATLDESRIATWFVEMA